MDNGSHPILKKISTDELMKLIFVSPFIPTSSPGSPLHSFFCLFPAVGKSVVVFFTRIPTSLRFLYFENEGSHSCDNENE
jgi:hypothetical protein